MSKSRKPRGPNLRKLFYLLATLATGSGAGGYAFPEMPVLGPAVKAAVEQFFVRGGTSPSNASTAQGPGAAYVPANGNGTSSATAPVTSVTATQASSVQVAPPRDTITIGSFNIQVFGTAKLQKQKVVEILAHVARSFDVLAIQEIRTQDDRFLDQFLQMVNAPGRQYSYLIGPRLGRTSSTEQYAFLFDTTRIEFNPASVATLNDPSDLLHREPMVAQFRARGVPPANAFSFYLMNVHTDPDEVAGELDVLAGAFQLVQRQAEDDVILLGDLNASENQLRALGQLPGIRCAIAGVPTNTRGTKTYDNLIFDSRATVEYTGQSGVWNLTTNFGLTQEQALEVSDHFPVWATFSIYEGGRPPLAARPVQPR